MGDLKSKERRIHNKWPFAREGVPFILGGVGLTLLLLYFGHAIFSIAAAGLTLFVTYFFRDPDRHERGDPKAVFSPADGKVLAVEERGNEDNPLGEGGVKISIFMSVFNVHVNRIPVAGTVKEVVYRMGKFFSANLDKASRQNERNQIILETQDSRKIVFIQIAGLIARRIACWIKASDHVEAGQRFGLIRFGSRVDIYLPDDTRITVKKGQKVKAGMTVIGHLS